MEPDFDPFEFIKADSSDKKELPCDKCGMVPAGHLHCNFCGVCKPPEGFRVHGGNARRGGRDYKCKECRKGDDKRWRAGQAGA